MSMEQVVKMDKLGPIIINSDGTMSRINGWENLTEGEREKSLRLIAKRNKARKETLISQFETEEQQTQQNEGTLQDQQQVVNNADRSLKDDSEVLAIEYQQS